MGMSAEEKVALTKIQPNPLLHVIVYTVSEEGTSELSSHRE